MNRVLVALCLVSLVSVASAKNDDEVGHKKTAWESPKFAKHKTKAMKLAADFKKFIGANKTEREVVTSTLKMAKAKGFKDLMADRRPKIAPGAKLYAVAHGKLAVFVIVGKKPITDGLHVVASHIDAVRIDLKQNPLYADGNMAMLETHYYGGIKRYQWLSTPLELRGVVVKNNGDVVKIAIGDDPNEPVLVIPDIAVHVSRTVDRTEGEDVPGESLDPIVSSTPAAATKDGGDPFAAEAARLLKSQYKIDVADLTSAELELVPADSPRDVGIDRAIIGAYGQDDRLCGYAALRALLSIGTPDHTAVVVLADKEEIGSTGNTGARSNFTRRVAAELLEGSGVTSTEVNVDKALSASIVFSADVTGAVNPHYKEVYELRNASFLGSGVVWDQSAIHAELMSYVRTLLDSGGITHQPSTWGKSSHSKGEGGTVLEYFTDDGMNGLDVSIPLLSMHAPYELVSKADLYEGYRAYRAFLAD